MTLDELKDAVIEGLTVQLESDPDFSQEVLEEIVNSVVDEVIFTRRYKAMGYTDADIEKDIVNYQSVIRKIALYDYNQSGMEFQTSSQENGIQRTYLNRRYLFSGIVPLANKL